MYTPSQKQMFLLLGPRRPTAVMEVPMHKCTCVQQTLNAMLNIIYRLHLSAHVCPCAHDLLVFVGRSKFYIVTLKACCPAKISSGAQQMP